MNTARRTVDSAGYGRAAEGAGSGEQHHCSQTSADIAHFAHAVDRQPKGRDKSGS